MSLSFCPPFAECHYRPAAEPYELPTLALMTLSDHRTRQMVLLVTFRLVPDKTYRSPSDYRGDADALDCHVYTAIPAAIILPVTPNRLVSLIDVCALY